MITSFPCSGTPCGPWGDDRAAFRGEILGSSATRPELWSLTQSSGRSQSAEGCILSEYQGKSGTTRRSPCMELAVGEGNEGEMAVLSEKDS